MSLIEQSRPDDVIQPAGEVLDPRIDVAGNVLTLFEGTLPLITAMAADIRAAQKRVWLESYTIADDSAGREIADALLDRAAAGVDVRVMFDAIGSLSTLQSYFDRLKAGGVQVHSFHSIWDNLWRLRVLEILNRRNHRKLLVIDDQIAYFGGMNIVDQRAILTPSDAKARHLPASAGWRDLHVRLLGPKQAEIADEMARLWRWKHPPASGQAPSAVAALLPIMARPNGRPAWRTSQMLATAADGIYLFASRPWRRSRRVARIFGPLIRRARREIIISMAYFIPSGRVLWELLKARKRGVRVRVVIPADSDVKLVQWATRHFCRFLLGRGIQIYERQDEMLHSKVMVIDGEWTVVGSSNLDPRSLRLNLEFLAVIHSRAMASAALDFCRREIAESQRIRLRDLRRRSFWHRLRDRLAWSLRRWL